ncbi:MAG: Glu-tRNA(Gln) amidotransferase subunit GatE [Nanoarchaeota archaeon]|nr:Glu-tRNA(Gln) amidotransferase subunit GatE [Nanoarchaeota archaeon]
MENDYQKVGLKAGLEIHQQIDTSKLFSAAPSYLRSDKPDYVIKRKLHAVAGESGEIDVAVKHEAVLDKEFYYEGYDDTVSLVELDESPPRPINEDALDIALQIALLLNCEIYPVTQVMRKTVIDGSNTSGFQRTVLIAHSGWIETSFGKVGIDSIALEEDSARIIKREKDKVVYRLDRLGIPLIEIASAPVMNAPEQVKEVALKIGEILRACRVKRGIGTIRQDVNVSIKGHGRVEIKGFQEPRMMVKTIELEVERQLNDLKKSKKGGEVRNALPSGETEFLRPLPGKSRMYPETDLALLKISRERINKLKKKLPKLRSDIRDELRKKGLSDEMINLVLSFSELDEFNALIRVYNRDANLIAKMITLWRNEFATKLKKSVDEIKDVLSERVYEKVLERVKSGKLDKSYVREVLLKILEGVSFNEAVKIEKIDDNRIEEEIRKIIKNKPGLRPNAYMGLVMKKFKGKIDARKAMEILKKIVG